MPISSTKIAILGGGTIGLSLAKGIVKADICTAEQITITRRNIRSIQAITENGFTVTDQNSEAVKNAEIIIIGVLPHQLNGLLYDIQQDIKSKHLIISLVTGVSIADIKNHLHKQPAVVRAMPNTAISVGESMTCIAYGDVSDERRRQAEHIFRNVGMVLEIKESLMTSATALCASGIAFFLRSIRAATQGGVEIGFHANEALKLVLQTAKGAISLLNEENAHPEKQIDKVTSPRGCTIVGLNEMEHRGFSSALIKGILLAAIKAGDLYEKEEEE